MCFPRDHELKAVLHVAPERDLAFTRANVNDRVSVLRDVADKTLHSGHVRHLAHIDATLQLDIEEAELSVPTPGDNSRSSTCVCMVDQHEPDARVIIAD